MAKVLIIDDERSLRELLEIVLGQAGHEVESVGDAEDALRRVAGDEVDLVITDLRLGAVSGQSILEAVKRYHPATEVVMITAFGTTEDAIEAMKAGAYDYLAKPFKVDELLVVVQKALEKRALVRENVRLKAALGENGGHAGLIGRSARMRTLYGLIEKVAPTRSTVLITGESGTGKELVARALHARSPRAAKPFVAINCGAIPETLMESELFGHAKGAFTGAQQAKPGLFELGDGGTVFLDEVGELPLALQVKLLRALQERRFQRVGGVEEVSVDVRLLAATNQDLAQAVEEGRFREDLYYRLNVIHLQVPSLRERREDILALAEHFLGRFARDGGRPLRLSREAARRLLDHPFPGNVRELENVIERAAIFAEGSEIRPDDLPEHLSGERRADTLDLHLPEGGLDLQAQLDEIERGYLRRALESTGGVKTEAARLLGLSFRSFRYRLDKLGIEGAPGAPNPG